jgi:prepilin-type N-terminal cleavage/methylation domain-containing protein/prepilin-type processing-associated H-X9-DG protein
MLKSTRKGFTLVELLVVIAIIGVLVALLLPAVQAARESARKMTCSTRLRELAQAAITFEGAKKRFPGAHDIVARDANAVISVATALGIGGTGGGANKVANWNVQLLPYLDQQQVYDLWDDKNVNIDNPELTQFIPIFSCPSRQSQWQTGAYTSFVANAGYLTNSGDAHPVGAIANKIGAAAAVTAYWKLQRGYNGVFVDRVPVVTSGTALLKNLLPKKLPSVTTTDIDDGLSNTLLFSESLMGGLWGASNPAGLSGGIPANINTTFMWMYRTDGSVTCATTPTGTVPIAPVTDMKINGNKKQYLDPTAISMMSFVQIARPSALHSGGVNVVFADKHTGFLSDLLDYDVYQQLMTTNAKKSSSYLRCYVLRAEDFGG